MIEFLSYVMTKYANWKASTFESKEEKLRRDMIKYLSQATDRIHLEYLEREWEKTYGKIY